MYGVVTGSGNLTVVGGNTLTLKAPNAYTGNTTVTDGTLVLNGAGSIAATAGVTINPAGILTLDNTVAFTGSNDEAMSGRLGTAPITLNGGTFNFNGSKSTQHPHDRDDRHHHAEQRRLDHSGDQRLGQRGGGRC